MSRNLDLGVYTFPWSLAEEGVERVLDDLQEQARCNSVVVAFTYHSAKFLHPRPHPHFHFTEPATAYFRPSESRYGQTSIRPVRSELARGRDVLAEVRAATRERGMRLHAWVLCLHSSVLGSLHPNAVVRNAFGDPHPFALSPSHPDVREYLCALVADIVESYEPDRVELESVEYVPTEHGHHHELDGIALDHLHRALLGLDFSDHALTDLQTRGVDAERARERVRRRLSAFFSDSGAPVDATSVLAEEPEIAAFFRERLQIIADLAQTVREAARSAGRTGVDVILSPWSRRVSELWLEGHSPALLAQAVDRLIAPLYFPDAADVGAELDALEQELGALEQVTPILLLLEQMTPNAEQLRLAVTEVQRRGIQRLNLYNHAFVRLETLGWIRQAAPEAGEGAGTCA